jgi:hypothetical protein
MNTLLTVLEFIQQHRLALAIGLVLGLLLGLAIGWWWWPVEWKNATPVELRLDFKDDYLVWVAEQYDANRNAEWAITKLLGSDYKDPKREKAVTEMLAFYKDELTGLAAARGGEDATRLTALADALEQGVDIQPKQTLWQRLRPVFLVCGVGLLLVLFVVAAWFLIARLRGSRAGEGPGAGVAEPARPVPAAWAAEGQPVAQFTTTYVLGDDHYDPSFSIELENGEFMGECGVGVSETIGVGAPNKVTALEVWLFDKSDIRTVTKVLMSDYAFHDEALSTKLAPKGEPVQAQGGKDVILETKTLRVRTRVAEVSYGTGNLPPNSFFERLTIDLAAWVKPGAETDLSAGDQMPAMPPTM